MAKKDTQSHLRLVSDEEENVDPESTEELQEKEVQNNGQSKEEAQTEKTRESLDDLIKRGRKVLEEDDTGVGGPW